WVHVDYDQLGMDPRFDRPYFEQLDEIVTVSEECAAILANRFPQQRHKIRVIYNVVSPNMICRMAEQEASDVYRRAKDEKIILSIGRLHAQKGFEWAVEACKRLVDNGCNVRWCVIGEGGEREKLTGLIRAHRLEGRFVLLGLKPNPYPYIR